MPQNPAQSLAEPVNEDASVDKRWRRPFRYLQIIASLLLVVTAASAAGLIAAPAVVRVQSLVAYLQKKDQTLDALGAHMVSQVRAHLGDPFVSVRSLDNWFDVDIADPVSGAAQIEAFVANSVGSNSTLWIPSTATVMNAYGLLLATMIDDDGLLKSVDRTGQAALTAYLDATHRKITNTPRSIKQRLEKVVSGASEPPRAELSARARKAARDLRNSLAGVIPRYELLRDFNDYLESDLSEEGTTAEVPQLKNWLSAKSDELEQIVADAEVDVSVTGADQVRRAGLEGLRASIWGRHNQVLLLRRPKWFKEEYIKQAQQRAIFSNSYNIFFGPNGLLRELPIAIVATKEPEYAIRLSLQDSAKLRDVFAQPGELITVIYPGGKLIAPRSSAVSDEDGVFWYIRPTQARARVVAVVNASASNEFRVPKL